MAKIKKETEEVTEEESGSWVEQRIKSLSKDPRFKGTEYNDMDAPDWRVSTGSIILDSVLSTDRKEGIGSQIVKIYGPFGAGKTSFLLNIAKNFQKLGPNYFVFIVNAEGRITDKLLEQAGISKNPSQYHMEHGQQAEAIFSKIRILMMDNNQKPKKDYVHFCVLIDSMDALIKKEDMEKIDTEGYDSNLRVGGNAVISKTFLKSASLPITAGKHLLLLTGQVITNINASKNQKKTLPSGGVGAQYFSSTMLEVKKAWTNTKIWEGEKEIGHYFELLIEKTANNQRAGETVLVPIKKDFKPGEAVWREVEAKDLMLQWGLIKKGGMGRFEMSETFSKELAENKIDHEEKFHGEGKIISHLEENEPLLNYAIDKLKKLLFTSNE